ncbi:protein MIS12-like protein isoform X1 [Iris pallida]|uniref:Protein MIS12-like protein isoform X1 n=1 Tax=Iris pallida TaxID=29817 RepID=A0AAX6HGR1_IRIPA|nr:protein MIS12-like protein isoform X1 [Iris pallida]
MEGSESEALFDAHNLNPQRFVNEVLNSVDDMLDGAFHFLHQQAFEITSAAESGADRSQDLAKGVTYLRHLIQAVVDKRMDSWEKYCLRHCFTVPEGILLPEDQNSSRKDLLLQEGLSDVELDSQLDSLRNKLAAVGKESADLLREKHSLEKESTLSHIYDSFVTETLQLLEHNSVHQMLREIGETASKLRSKMGEVKIKRSEHVKRARFGRVIISGKKHVPHDPGLSASIEDIQEAANILKTA